MNYGRAAWAFFSLGVAGAAAAPAEDPARIPVRETAERFLRNFAYSNFDLSPDGSHLSMIIHGADYDSMGTYDVAAGKLNTASGKAGQDVYAYDWIDGDHLLTNLSQWDMYHVGMYVSDQDLKNFRAVGEQLEGWDDGVKRARSVLKVLDPLPMVAGKALLADTSESRFFPIPVVYDLDGSRLNQAPGRTERDRKWVCDSTGAVRYVLRITDPGKYEWVHRKAEGADWEVFPVPDETDILGFDPTGDRIFVDLDESLEILDARTGERVGRSVTHPVFSCRPSLLKHRESDTVVGFAYYWDKPQVVYFDPGFQQIHSQLQPLFPDATCRILGQSQRNSLFFEISSDVWPDCVYELTYGEKTGITQILNQAPWIDPKECQAMEPIRFQARDGKQVQGYLTRSRTAPDRPGPTVMRIHGGPYARDHWGFDREVQFLSHLGYHVIQVNFRGSTGFSKDYSVGTDDGNLLKVCGYGVTDVADAARWAIAEGIADRERIAIMGGSFGGYAALAGAAFEPDLYKVAIGFAGVYDFDRQLVASFREHQRLREWAEPDVGDIKSDPALYRNLSPVHFADRIQAEVLLLHGSADRTVSADQSKRMSKALKKAKRPHTLKITNWGIHGHINQKERIDYGVLVGEFLQENL